MKKTKRKRILAGILSAVLTVTAVPLVSMSTTQKEVKAASTTLQNPRIEKDDNMDSGQKVTWDCIWFGSYPQREVVANSSSYSAIDKSYYNPQTDVIEDMSLYRKLVISTNWVNNEITLNGNKYRRVQESDAEYTSISTNYYRWSGSSKWHYFKYEPIKWRVLNTDSDQAFIQTDLALDVKGHDRGYANVTWEASSIRSWLNGYKAEKNQLNKDYTDNNFQKYAFNEREQGAIVITGVSNPNNSYGVSGGNDTEDKLFLLSQEEVSFAGIAEIYGLIGNEPKRRRSSTYAKARGVWNSLNSEYAGNCTWWLRSPGDHTRGIMLVDDKGSIIYGNILNYHILYDQCGVCPALNLNLSSSDLWSYAGTVCSDGTVNEQATSGSGGNTTTVDISKNAVAEEILEKIDLNNLLGDISLGETQITGPSIKIGNKSIPLFNFDASMNLKLSDEVQAKIDMKNKTLQVLVGFDKFEGSATLDEDTNSSNYWKESYAQVKSLYKGMVGENVSTDALYHRFQKLRGKLRKQKCAIGISASAEMAGWLEFSFASGSMQYNSGGIILSAGVDYEEIQRWPSFPVLYAIFGLKADLGGKLTIEKVKEMEYIPSIETSFGVSAAIGAGAGSQKLGTYAELRLHGNINMALKYPALSLSEAMNIKLSAQYSYDTKVFGFDGPKKEPTTIKEVQIYPKEQNSYMAHRYIEDFSSFDWNTAKPMSRNYLNRKIKAQSKSISNKNNAETTFIKNQAYPYNNAKIVSLNDGKQVLFWIDDDGNKTDINRTSLMYAVCEKGTWSTPVSIAETGGANDYPAVFSDGKKAVVVWQKAQTMDDTSTLPEVLKSVELYMAVYENGKLQEMGAITSLNEDYEMMQSVAVMENEIAVVWIENSENDPLQTEGTNKIKLAVTKGDSWNIKTIDDNVGVIQNLKVAYLSGEPVLAYETSEGKDTVIHYWKGEESKNWSGFGVQIENEILYYSDETSIKSYNMRSGEIENLNLPAMTDFLVVDKGNQKALYTTEETDGCSEVVTYIYDYVSKKWNNKVSLTDFGQYIRNYSVVQDEFGNPQIALNLLTVNKNSEEISDESTLMVLAQKEYTDLIIGDGVTYEEDLVYPGSKLPLSFEVLNNSNHTVDKITVQILDENRQVISATGIECYLPAGDTTTAQIFYQLPQNLIFGKKTVSIKAEGEERISDNEREFYIGYTDLKVNEIYISGKRSEAFLEGSISNNGYNPAQNVKANFYYQDAITPFATETWDTVNNQKSVNFKVAIPEKYMQVNPMATGNRVIVKIESDMQELNYANNEKEVLLKSEEDMSIAFQTDSLEMKVQEENRLTFTYCDYDLSQKEIIWTSSNDQVVMVNDGNIKAVGIGTAIVTASINDIVANCTIIVSEDKPPVREVVLNQTSLKLEVGEKQNLKVNVLPQNAIHSQITWTSSNPEIVQVSKIGEVTGIGLGESIVEATAEDGYHFAKCRVVVRQKEPELTAVSSIKLSENKKELTIGQKFVLMATVAPENATNKEVVWSSENENVASVDEKGIVTAKESGNTVIKVTAQDGSDVMAQCSVIVKEKIVESESQKESETTKESETAEESETTKESETAKESETIKESETTKEGETIKESEKQTENRQSSTQQNRIPKIGDKIRTKTAVYRVIKTGKATNNAVTLERPTKKTNRTFSVPSTIKSTDGKYTFKVTGISKNAFKKKTKLKKIVLGKNVKIIGANAFSGCKNLKTIKITSTFLTKKSIGKNAFKGIYKKAVIKVPKKKLKSYQKILKGKCQAKSVKIKK